MKYFVRIGEREFVVEVDGADVSCDGTPHRAELVGDPNSPMLQLVLDQVRYSFALELETRGAMRLVDRGAVRDVTVEDERARHTRLLSTAARPADQGVTLKAPMPGLVIRVGVAVGDRVEAGAALIVLEAMKMENELKATTSGVITAIHTAAGTAVEKGQPLLELGTG